MSNDQAVRRLLMIAYHFPPLAGSSGIQRTLRFVQHLPRHGWEPLVLSVHPRAYPVTSPDLLSEIPPGVVVRRAFALDTARQLQIAGRYPGVLARPDRWMTWQFDGVRRGLQMVNEFRPKAIWSTYPIATAHRIGWRLHRRTGLPWIADFRDPMAQDGYPADPKTWRSYLEIEAVAADEAAFCVFATPGAADMYAQRYPASRARFVVIENGYDEQSFAGLTAGEVSNDSNRRLVLLHSGIVYESERDPTQLFIALGRLLRAGRVDPSTLCIRLRASMHDASILRLAQQHGAETLIELGASLPYRAALQEMMNADGLLVLQASNCNAQIPAKLYEYLRAGRPIIGLTDPAGDTASTLRRAGCSNIIPLDSAQSIEAELPLVLDEIRQRKAPIPQAHAVMAASREQRTVDLARLLSRLAA